MKRIVSILTFAILAVTLSAQNLVAVSGAVYGTANGCAPAPYAKMELLTPDGKIVVNTQCDGQGNYRLQAPAGKYHLRVSSLGYYPTGRDLSLVQDMRLDTIKLFPDRPASVLGVEIFPIKGMNIQEMYDFNRGHCVTTTEGFYRAARHAVSYRMDIYHPFDRTRQTTLYAEAGYTFHFKPRLGGWGIHAGWEGAQFGGGWDDVWNAYMVGVEYERFRPNGHMYHFRLLLRYTHNLGWPFFFSFDWDIPRLFTVEGLSFCGKLDLLADEYSFESAETSFKGMLGSMRLEPQIWYNLSHLWSSQGKDHYMGREGLGVFFKLPITYNYPGGWYYGNNYYKNYYRSITPCLGLRWDF